MALAAALSKTAAAGTAQVAVTAQVSESTAVPGLSGAPGAATTTPITGQGQIDLTKAAGQFSLTLPATEGGSAQVVFSGGNLYLDIPALSAFTGGKPWISLALGGPSTVTVPSQAKILSILQQTATVTTVGPATVSGQATTEYLAQVDLGKVLALLVPAGSPAKGSPTTAGSHRTTRSGLLGPIPVDVWVNAQGLVVQVGVQTTVLGLTVQGTAGLSGFGSPVTVTAPPADQTVSGSSLLQGLGGKLFGGGVPTTSA